MTALVSGPGSLGRAGDLLPDTASRVALLYTESVQPYAERVASACARAGRAVVGHVMPDAEAAKTAGALESAWAACARGEVARGDVVVAVGGGALTDAAGFAAATWLRGVAWIAVPTTTLGMTDAAHGGKVAINTPSGKNLVGAFHVPLSVILDPGTLATLPQRDLKAGLVEAVKCAWLAGRDAAPPMSDSSALGAAVLAAAEYKRELVARDPFEHGERALLNYGHTLGHAIEAASGLQLRHGEAVAIGMVFAAEVSERLGVADPGLADRHRATLTDLGVPTSWAGAWDDLAPFLRQDKKRGAAGQRWVLLAREGEPKIVTDVPGEVLLSAFAAVRR